MLPGSSRAISYSLSASRDNPRVTGQFTPRSSLSAGGDFAIFGLRSGPVSARLGIVGMIELEETERREDWIPGEITYRQYIFWRGLLGCSISLSLDEFAENHLGEHGKIEFTLSARHESEHFSDEVDYDPVLSGVPDIGDFIMPDIAVQIPWGQVDVDVRGQLKMFLDLEPHENNSYTYGPGGDLIFRWHASDRIHPFNSTFAEYLFGEKFVSHDYVNKVPDNYLVRNLTGIVVRGKYADLHIFTSLEIGHGKGKIAFKEERRMGIGFRLDFPEL